MITGVAGDTANERCPVDGGCVESPEYAAVRSCGVAVAWANVTEQVATPLFNG